MFLLGLWCSVEGVGAGLRPGVRSMFTQAQTVLTANSKTLLTVGWVDAWDQEGFGDLLQAHAATLLALRLGGHAEDFPGSCLQLLADFLADFLVLGEVVAGGFRAAEVEVSFGDVAGGAEDLG